MWKNRCPKVSVIIPAYNNADYTVEAVESVLQQTYSDYEVIVVDDGSTDHTQDVLRPYFDRLQYVYKENGGACSARNLGIKISRGEYVACLDCDDLWLPNKLEYSVPVLDANPDMAFVFTVCYLIDSDGNILGGCGHTVDFDKAYRCLLFENYIPAPTVIMRRSCLDQIGLFDENIFIPADWDLWLRLSKGFPIGYIDLPLSKYRLASSYARRHLEQSLNECMYVLEKQLRVSSELSLREKNRIIGKILFNHGMAYREVLDTANARKMLCFALKHYPYDWRPYLHLLLSSLGGTAWGAITKLKNKMRFKVWIGLEKTVILWLVILHDLRSRVEVV